MDEEEKDGFLLFFNSILFSLFFRIKIQQDDKTLSLFSMRILRFAFFLLRLLCIRSLSLKTDNKNLSKKKPFSLVIHRIYFDSHSVLKKKRVELFFFFSFLSFSSFSFFYNITTERLYTTSTCREIERAVCQQDHPMAAVFRHRVIR